MVFRSFLCSLQSWNSRPLDKQNEGTTLHGGI
jgi:hypothetical protein